jgi:hypothetical protein
MNKYPLKFSGGTVTKIGNKKWQVNAPDGRNVGEFNRKCDAVNKAQNWDKWDAFDSLHEICLIVSPFTTELFSKVIMSKGEYTPTDEEMQSAIASDFVIAVFRSIARDLK